eukprot:TRINITY_DN54447_c0_g1_i1.p1 TRINITY_DN54447_c0_g1~~TRINITY_DN54447_c0_g1_i1.p1  ORF type:complete len:381 (+),score=26.46 TRINITY_DN54447_c0_g1_i1:27-1145(+)
MGCTCTCLQGAVTSPFTRPPPTPRNTGRETNFSKLASLTEMAVNLHTGNINSIETLSGNSFETPDGDVYPRLLATLVPKLLEGSLSQPCCFWWFPPSCVHRPVMVTCTVDSQQRTVQFRKCPVAELDPGSPFSLHDTTSSSDVSFASSSECVLEAQSNYVSILTRNDANSLLLPPAPVVHRFCATCRKFESNGGWLDPEEFYLQLLTKGSLNVRMITHILCGHCGSETNSDAARSRKYSYQNSELRRKPVILIVDDDLISASLVEKHVKKAGCNTTVATSGFTALRFMESHAVDVLITDIVMPGLSGLELLSCVRKKGLKAKCIGMSGFADYREMCLASGMVAFLGKPLSLSELQEALSRALSADYDCQQHC